LPQLRVTVAIPTLNAGETLGACVRSLRAQSIPDFEIVVIDNSGKGLANQVAEVRECARVIENSSNLGFGAAVNQAIRSSSAPFIATLNDDAVAHPGWLEAMLRAAEAKYEIGMCAPQIRLFGEERLDSAGMLLCRDGSSKQRAHLEPASDHNRQRQTVFPSGCAALYRRDMLDEIGLFDERFFLYCEDTDLGLRARWKLWECVYVPDAIVEHHYSKSAGPASPLKAYYVERNRLFVLLKNFPARDLWISPVFSVARYFWHAVYVFGGRGKAAEYTQGGGAAWTLPWHVLRAHAAVIPELPALLRQRREIRRKARMRPVQFRRMLASYGISPRQVAAL
jgi:GT2 family glycosyltransferase